MCESEVGWHVDANVRDVLHCPNVKLKIAYAVRHAGEYGIVLVAFDDLSSLGFTALGASKSVKCVTPGDCRIGFEFIPHSGPEEDAANLFGPV
jgi:hypothetical protein